MPTFLHAVTRSAAPGGVELEAMVQHLFHAGHAHACEQRHAAAQTVLVIRDFAAHGGFGGCGNLGLAASRIGNLVHTLNVDEGGVHVEGDELEIAQFQGRGEALNNQAGGEFSGGCKLKYYVFYSLLCNTDGGYSLP